MEVRVEERRAFVVCLRARGVTVTSGDVPEGVDSGSFPETVGPVEEVDHSPGRPSWS